MKKSRYSQLWNLDSIFQGGSTSLQFEHHLQTIETALERVNKDLQQPKKFEQHEAHVLLNVLREMSDVKEQLSQASSFITCLRAQNSSDEQAIVHQGRLSKLNNAYDVLRTAFQQQLAAIAEPTWSILLQDKRLKDFELLLTDWRNEHTSPLSLKEKAMLASLATDGYHAWGQMYQTLMSQIEVTLTVDGISKQYSAGQAINLRAHPNEHVRKMAHEALEHKWVQYQQPFAQILNHLAGFRLQMYELQGIDHILQEPLHKNRLTEQTVESMWRAVQKQKPPFQAYLKQKAAMQGSEKMQAYHFWAPLSATSTRFDYDKAIDFIAKQCEQFAPTFQQFVLTAAKERWIECESRAKKSAAAFCASFPMTEQSRIFMTFEGTMLNVLTLAHELGHGFHNFAMNGRVGLQKQYPLCIAETASTFAELMVLDAAIETAQTTDEKRALLDEKLKRSVMNFMHLHSRFLFEQTFYEERKKGVVSAPRLNELMRQALDMGYANSMEGVSVYSWLWTPHFYITSAPFYNFPYTFGYLIATSLVVKAKELGPDFETAYMHFLRDSGTMTMEQLMLKHFHEDISVQAFWEKAMRVCIQDVETFMRLVDLREE